MILLVTNLLGQTERYQVTDLLAPDYPLPARVSPAAAQKRMVQKEEGRSGVEMSGTDPI